MKTIRIVIVLAVSTFIFCYSCIGQNANKNDLTALNLKGKVKSISETYYKAIDTLGIVKKGVVTYKNLLHFDSKGNTEKFKKIMYNTIVDLDKKITYKYKYDSNGNLIEWDIFNLSKLDNKCVFNYDKDENMIEEDCYNSKGKLFVSKKFTYDANGNMIEENWYNSDNSLESKINHKYDNNRNEIEQNSYNSDGTLLAKCTFTYEYDKISNWVTQTMFQNNIPLYIRVHQITYY